MFKISSESELLGAFRTIDREEIQLPESLGYPAFVPDYLTWVEPAGHRTFLVFKPYADKPPFGIVFRRNPGGHTPPSMCEWCQTIRPSSEVSLMTAKASGNRVIGIHACNDLSCREKAHKAMGNGPEKVKQIIRRMSTFAFRNLF